MRAKFGRITDLEKLLAKIFTYSVKHKTKAIYFEDVSLQKLKEFKTLLMAFKDIEDYIAPLRKVKNEFRSERLYNLVTPNDLQEHPGLFPGSLKLEIE